MKLAPATDCAPSADARVVLFRRGKILTDREGGILHALDPAYRALSLGVLDGRPCFVAEIDAEPLGCTLVPLRAAFVFLPEELFVVASTAAQVLRWDADHRFCSRCAAALEGVAGERARRCAACDLTFYPRISPAVIVLVHDGRRALLTHKEGTPFHALVAGFVEPGESLEDAVRREVKEETGVDVGELRYFGSQTWPFPHQMMIGYFARWVGGEVVADGKELDHAAWYAVDDLPTVPPRGSIAGKMIEAWAAGAHLRPMASEAPPPHLG
jgi:NAD+ diphosphatase